MPFPYFENIGTDFTGTWSSPRNRKPTAATTKAVPQAPPPKRKANTPPCPHTMTIVRTTRQLAAEKKQCQICIEDYFSAPGDREKVTPVQLPCSHTFCRECIETHLSSSIICPLPWCELHLPLQPAACELCAMWQKDNAATGSVVVTVRVKEMLSSIKAGLAALVQEHDFYDIPRLSKGRLFAHIRTTLKRYEWQFHSGVDLAELLDPFLLAVHIEDTRAYYSLALSAPILMPSPFPPRTHDADDYPAGQEPWIAAFFRQWALDYEKENGEVRDGWGDWTKKTERDSCDWDWPYKAIVAHKTGREGKVEYLVKWVGQRHFPSWVEGEQLDSDAREVYDRAHGVVHEDPQPKKRRKT